MLDGTGQLAAHGWLAIIALPTIASAIFLMQPRKLGVFVSLGVLPLLGFALGMSVFSMLGESGIEMAEKVLIDFAIASVLSLLGPLLLGWKNMKWKRTHKRTAHVRSFRTAASAD